MSHGNFWSRLRKGRVFQVLLVYLGVSWVVLQVVAELRETLDLPRWIGPVTLILLLVGLLIVLATAWVQSHPLVDAREEADEVPRSWEVDLGDALSSVRRGRLPHLTWGRALLAGVMGFALLFGAAGLYVGVVQHGVGGGLGVREAVAEAAPDGVAVLPFAVTGASIDDWREGMVDLISTGLDGAGGLRAIASRTVLARWHEMVPDGGEADERSALAVARKLDARYAMLGTAVAIGPTVRLTVQVHQMDPEATRRLGQVQVQGPPDSVLALVDSLSLKTLALLMRRDPGDLPRVDLASVTTSSLPALKSYLEGESLFRRDDFAAAAEAYGRAVAADSTFGLAYYRLSQAYGWDENINSERGADASRRAMALLDRLPERVALLVRGESATARFDPAAVEILQRAVKKYPDDAEAWYALGDAQLHVREALYGWDEAEEAFRRAVRLAPGFAPYRIHLLDAAFRYHADSAMVEEQLAALERVAPESHYTFRYRLAAELAFGDSARREAAFGVLRDSAGQTGFGTTVSGAVSNPRFFDRIGERVYRLGLEHAPAEIGSRVRGGYANALLHQRGRLRDALSVLDDPSVPVFQRLVQLFTLHSLGLPVPAARIEALARDPAAGELGPAMKASMAAEEGQSQLVEKGAAEMEVRADSLAAAGDTLEARIQRARAGALRGYAYWHAGRIDDAIRVLDASLAYAQGPPINWWLGMLELQKGRPAEAVRYMQPLMTWTPDPLAAYYIGQAYQAEGERDKARQMLSFFAENWKGADPELQPMVRDAQARLAALVPDRAQ